MACSVKQNIIDHIELEKLGRSEAEGITRTAPIATVMQESRKLSSLILSKYDVPGLPFRAVGKNIALNDPLFDAIDNKNEERGEVVVTPAYVQEAEAEVLSSMRSAMKKLGVTERAVSRLRDREGNVIAGIAAADIISKSITYVEGNESEIPEEVIHMFVVAMNELKDPIYTSMYERIAQEPEYLEVQEEYGRLADWTEQDIKDEAITKVILNRMKLDAKEKAKDRNARWWQRLLRKLREVFNFESDPVKKAVKKVLSEDISKYAEALSRSKRETIFRSLGDATTQDIQRENIVKTHNSMENVKDLTFDMVKGKIDEGTFEILSDIDGVIARYKIDGKLVAKRATDQSSISFFKSVGNIDEYKSISNRERSALLRDTGTNMHSIQHEIALNMAQDTDLEYHKYINVVELKDSVKPRSYAKLKEDSGLDKQMFLDLKGVVKGILDKQVARQKAINKKTEKDKKTDMYTEVRLFNKKMDTGGTVDLMFINSEGTASIYDWKFMSPKFEDVTKKGEDFYMLLDPFRGAKGEGYQHQMGFYVTTLREQYGITKIQESRLIPVHLRFKYVNKKITNTINYLAVGSSHDRFLAEMPMAKEKAGDRDIDSKLKILYDKFDAIKNRPKSPSIKRQVALITTAIRELLNESDMQHTFEELLEVMKYAEAGMKIDDSTETGYLEFDELWEIYDLLGTFKNLQTIVAKKIKLSKDSEKEKATLRNKLEKAAEAVSNITFQIQEKLIERLDIDSPYKLGEQMKRYGKIVSKPTETMDQMLAMNMVDNALFKEGYFRITEGRSRKDALYREHYKKWKALDDGLKSWAGSMPMRDVYNLFIRETPFGLKLITMFDPEFKKTLDKKISTAQSTQDDKVKKEVLKWMKEHFQIKKGAKEEFKANRAEFLERKRKEFGSKEDQRYKNVEAWFDSKNNVFSKVDEASAWTSDSYHMYLELKPGKEDAAFSSEYKYLLRSGNEPLLEYYNAWKEQMKTFKKLLKGRRAVLSADTIPSITKNMMEQLMTGENAFKAFGKSFLRGMSIDVENEEQVGKATIQKVPLRFLNPPKGKDGEVDHMLISRDLTRAMVMFGDSAYEHIEDTRSEAEILFIRDLLTQSEEVKMSGGKIVKELGEFKFEEGGVSEKTLSLFDTYVNMLLYKNFGQNIGKEINFAGRTISSTKLLRGVKSGFSSMIMTMPVKAALATLGGASVFRISKSIDNPNYSYDTLSKGFKLWTKDKSRYMAIAGHFDVHAEGDAIMHSRELSADPLTRNAQTSYLYYPLIPVDKFGDRRLLMGMLFNHAVDENGLIQRLEDMPEGTLPLAETMKVEDGVVTEDLPQSIRKQIKMRFLGEIRGIRGDMSETGVAAYQSNIYVSLVMQFKDWMPPMVQDRFGDVRFDYYTGNYEAGRYKLAAKSALFLPNATAEDMEEEVAWKTLMANSATTMSRLLGNLVGIQSFVTSKKTRDKKDAEGKWSEAQEAQYQRRRKKYLQGLDFIKENSTDPALANMTEEKYLELMQRSIKSTVAEIRATLILGLLSLFMGSQLGDDDEELYKANYGTRKAQELLARTILETAMFINPMELAKLNKSVVPLFGLLEQTGKFFGNSADEAMDLFRGDMFEKGDRAQMFHYTFQFVPGNRTIRWALDL